MNEAFYAQTAAIEDDHWWFVTRRHLIHELLIRFPVPSGQGRALDVGCGSGGNLRLLERHCPTVFGIDRSATALGFARGKLPGARLIQGDANRLDRTFRAASFDLITVFHVLYHRWVQEESGVLRGISTLLRPGGRLIVTEPAFRFLFRRHDRLDYGRTRYTVGELRAMALMDRAGPGGMADEGTERPDPVGELTRPAPWIDRIARTLGRMERNWMLRFGSIPIGVSAVLIAERPHAPRDQVRT